MAFDGFTTAALTRELSDKLTGGRIYRIIQPENDELILTIKPMIEKGGGTVKLYLSADPSLPLCYLTEDSRQAPASAPAFCMLLRKYLQNGKIISVTQPGLERVIRIEIEHMNEMGDLASHTLIIELMGKHSNIILTDAQDRIMDSIKRISQMVSSVREVLPGRTYFIPETQGKRNPFDETFAAFEEGLLQGSSSPAAYLVRTYTGFSNIAGEEITFRAHLSQDRAVSGLDSDDRHRLWDSFSGALRDVIDGRFSLNIYYHLGAADTLAQGEPVEYASMRLSMYRDLPAKEFASASSLLETYYAQKNAVTRIRQKSADLRHVVQTLLERDVHKYDLQRKQMADTEKRDKYRVYGELLNTYGYNIPDGAKSAELDNYYTGEKLTVPLDPQLSAQQNAKKYFDRYTKLKRTLEALTTLTAQVKDEIDHLEEIRTALDIATTEGDLSQIRQEMADSGFIRRPVSGKNTAKGGKKGSLSAGRSSGKGAARTPESKPLHYISSDGYDIYVGKNNTQNDALTFHFAAPTDVWFHANDIAGSHVILRTGGKPFEQLPDRAFEEAASLAAHYSKSASAGKVEVDYLLRRDVKKPGGARPGFVVYYTNYSLIAGTDISALRLAEE